MKPFTSSLILLAGLPLAGVAVAQSSSYSPSAGYFQLPIIGARDNHLSIPLVRPAASFFRVASADRSKLTARSGMWKNGQFREVETNQNRVYYAEFCSGALKGIRYRVRDNSEDTVILDTQDEDLTAHPLGGVGFDTVVRLSESWRVGAVLGSTDQDLLLDPRPDASTSADSLILPDHENIGQNKPGAAELFFIAGVGWRSDADLNQDEQHRSLEPGVPFVVRRRAPGETSLVVIGQVAVGARAVHVAADEASGNDSYVSLLFPEPVRLGDSGLVVPDHPEASVIQSSRSRLLRGDELLAHGAHGGLDLAPERSFFFMENAGWREAGNDSSTAAADFLLQPGKAYLIRKKPGSPGVDWVQQAPGGN